MTLINIALTQYGAQVIEQSSTNKVDAHSNHVCTKKQDEVWNSAEGLPQYLIISLEKVNINYTNIQQIGFHCWHDYPTNPKSIDLEVAQSKSGKYIFWNTFTLNLYSGKQFFSIQQLPKSYRILKFIITETYGDYETYLNQVYIMARKDDQKVAELDYADIKQNKQVSQSRISQSIGIKDKNDHSNYKYQQQYTQNDQFEDYDSNKFQQNDYILKQSICSSRNHQNDLDKSLNRNITLHVLTKNVIEMQQNVEIIKRQLEVLTLKTQVSYEQMEGKLMRIFQAKIADRFEEIRGQLYDFIKLEINGRYNEKEKPKHHNSKKLQDFSSNSSKRHRSAKKSLHLQSLRSNQQLTQQQGKQALADLMSQLAKKLKQRELKLKKIESKKSKDNQRNHRLNHQ